MPQNEFKVGDVVKLNSGGQEMTVSEVVNHMVYCEYWNDEKKAFLSASALDYRTLTKVDKTD